MKQQVSIRIKGVYGEDADSDLVELFTDGTRYYKNGATYLSYDESRTTGFEGCHTMLKITDEIVTMTRKGDGVYSHLVMQNGVRNVGCYQVYGVPMDIGVTTSRMAVHLDPDGGSLYVKYALDMNSSLLSENELHVEFKKIN